MLGRDDASKPPQEHQPGLYDKVMGALGFGAKPQQETSDTTAAGTSQDVKAHHDTPDAITKPAIGTTSSSMSKQGSNTSSSSSGSSHDGEAYPLAADDNPNKPLAATPIEHDRLPSTGVSSGLRGSKRSDSDVSTGVEGVTHGVAGVTISPKGASAHEASKASEAHEGFAATKSTSISSSSSSSSSESESVSHTDQAKAQDAAMPHVTSPTGIATAHGGTGKPGVVASSAVPAATSITAPTPGTTTATTTNTTETAAHRPSETEYGTPGAHNAQGKKGMLGKVTDKAKHVVSTLQDKAHGTKQMVSDKIHKK